MRSLWPIWLRRVRKETIIHGVFPSPKSPAPIWADSTEDSRVLTLEPYGQSTWSTCPAHLTDTIIPINDVRSADMHATCVCSSRHNSGNPLIRVSKGPASTETQVDKYLLVTMSNLRLLTNFFALSKYSAGGGK
jgi:hypothetical protein